VGAIVLRRIQSDAADGQVEVVAVALADEEPGTWPSKSSALLMAFCVRVSDVRAVIASGARWILDFLSVRRR